MNVHQILYQLYLLGYRTGEIAIEMGETLPLTPPPLAHLLSIKNRLAAMSVMLDGYGDGEQAFDAQPLSFEAFDMHVLEDLDYDY